MAQSSGRTEQKYHVPEYLKNIGTDPRTYWPRKYRFTREVVPGRIQVLSISQRNFYENNGYIIIDEAVPKKLVQLLAQGTQNDTKILEKFLAHQMITTYASAFCDERLMLMTGVLVDKICGTHSIINGGRANNSIKARHGQNYSIDVERKKKNATNGDTINIDEFWARQGDSMIKQPMMMMISSSNDEKKPPNIESAANFMTTGHQLFYRDYIYLPFRPIDKVVCCVSALEPIDHVLVVVPGTHRLGQCNIKGDSNDTQIYESTPSDMRTLIMEGPKSAKYVNLKPGQTFFYHPALVHGFSEDLVNSSQTQRAVMAYYAAADCEFIDYKLPPELGVEQDMVPTSLAHFGTKHPSEYTSWLGRPKLVRDMPNL